MTPNFALELSEDGIVLLHRHQSGDGWVSEGRVDFASDDISSGLEQLRDTAIALEGEGFATKLVLPASQLLYTTVEVDQDVEGDVATALSEQTPYSADQLSFAISGDGDAVQVVAVARETLAEAEAFIAPYGLNPMGFTAQPEPEQFDGEPNLGATEYANGTEFLTDPSPIRVIERPLVLDDPVSEEPEESEEPEDEAEETGVSEYIIEDVDVDAEEETAVEADASEAEDQSEPESDAAEAKDESSDAEPEREEDEEDAPPAAFSSRRSSNDAETAETGLRVTKLAARIGVHDNAPKVGAAPSRAKPTGVEKSSTKSAPIVPPVPPRRSTLKSDAAALPLAKADPIAELAAKERRGKPRFLGLILTVILLVALGVAALLSTYLLPDDVVSRFFPADESQQTTDIQPGENDQTNTALFEGDENELANFPIDSEFPDFTQPQLEDYAEELDDYSDEVTPQTPETLAEPLTEQDAATVYAATGIWQHAPTLVLDAAGPQTLNDLYVASLDPNPAFEDAPALTGQSRGGGEVELASFSPPPPPGVIFDIDERGLVRATPEGSISQNGVMIFAGKPPTAALQRPTDEEPEAVTADAEAETDAEKAEPSRLAAIRPQQRPENLIETQERATLGGLSRPELAKIRPQQRPISAQAQAEAIARALAEAETDNAAAAEEKVFAATKLAVAASRTPQRRPGNFDKLVANARAARTESSAAVQSASASTASAGRATGPAVVRTSRAAPTGPTRATVARAATDTNAIALGKVALVGVFGTSSNRRALVRMPNGRFKKVSVGDRIDGGRVAAIDSGSLRYTKSGRTVTLKMPKG